MQFMEVVFFYSEVTASNEKLGNAAKVFFFFFPSTPKKKLQNSVAAIKKT